MKLVTFAIDTPVGEIRRAGAIRKDGFYVDLSAGRELMLTEAGMQNACIQAERDCPSDMLRFIKAGQAALDYGYEVLGRAESLGTEPVGGLTVVYDPGDGPPADPDPQAQHHPMLFAQREAHAQRYCFHAGYRRVGRRQAVPDQAAG